MQFNLYAANIRIFSYTRRLIVSPMRLKYNAVPSQISSTKIICTYLHTYKHTYTFASQIGISQQHMIHTTQTPNYFLSMLRVYFIAVFFFYNLLPVSSPRFLMMVFYLECFTIKIRFIFEEVFITQFSLYFLSFLDILQTYEICINTLYHLLMII